MKDESVQLYAVHNEWDNEFQTGMTKAEVKQFIENFINDDGSPELIAVYLNPVKVEISVTMREVEVEFK